MQESAWAAAAAEVEAAAGESSPEGGESLLEPPGDSSEPAEEVAIEAEWSEEEVSVADEAPSDAATAEDMPFEMEADAGTGDDFSTTTARQGWISRAASLGEDQVGEVPPGTAEEEGAPAGQEYSEEAPAESGYAEADAPVEAGQDESGSYATEEELPAGSEGWVAVQEEQPQDAGWAEEAVSYTPLSPADLRTLDALGLDPSDAAAAQRMLACLVRVLNRR